jgi:phosphatidylglycerol lysyltransferase
MSRSNLIRWLLPCISVAIFIAVIFVIHRELAGAHLREVLRHFRSVPAQAIIIAVLCSGLSYWLLGFYDLLGLRYIGKRIAYGRTMFTAFIANAFGHNLGVAAFTGAAVRYRLYGSQGLNAADVATLAGFCSITTGIGFAFLAGVSLTSQPGLAAALLHVPHIFVTTAGVGLLLVVLAYLLWSSSGRVALEIRGWSLRPPSLRIATAQLLLAVIDLALAAAVAWALLPADHAVGFVAFVGLYSIAMVAGILSHVPGGLGVVEGILLLALPQIPTEQLLGSLLLWRALYYLLPLIVAALFFGAQEVRAGSQHLSRIEQLAAGYITPIVPQVAGALVFLSGFVLLVSGATPAVDSRLALLEEALPLAVLEVSHLVGSIIGVGLLILARALFRRIGAAYQMTLWLLGAGIVASLLKGLDFEEGLILGIVMAVLWLGRRAFYRKSSILEIRFTPAWLASILIVVSFAVWIGFFAQRHVDYSNSLWWTFALDGDAPRMLRASVVVVMIGAGFIAMNLLRPARPEPGITTPADMERVSAVVSRCSQTLASVALTGDKRLLFHEAGDAFIMYQIAGRSWIALGDPVGPRERHEELVWAFRELSDRHGGWSAFYQVSGERLPLYVDLGLAALKLGEEARVLLTNFTLEGSARAELRTARRRAEKDGASFEVIAPEAVASLLPRLQAVSDAWLEDKATAEKGFSVGFFSPEYLQRFPIALVRTEGSIAAFANLWVTADREEISVDMMRFGPDAPRGAMDYLFIELMLWGSQQGYKYLNIGMAPLAGLEKHPLAPAWHRVGNFVFRYGEHFYNFDGLRRYKEKFNPEWEPKYLVAPGGLALPRILIDVSVLIAGGVKELFTK